MAVPSERVTAVELNKAHSALEHPAREQAAQTEFLGDFFVQTVERARRVAFPGNVHDLRRVLLHPERKLVGRDARREFRVLLASPEVLAVQLIDEVDRRLLLLTADALRRIQIQ